MANTAPLNLEEIQDAKIEAMKQFAARFRTARATIPSLLGMAMTDITLTFSPAFADTSYTVAHIIEQPAALVGIVVSSLVVAKTASSVTVRVKNLSALAMTPTIDVIAIHD